MAMPSPTRCSWPVTCEISLRLGLLLAAWSWGAVGQADWRDDIGYTRLTTTLSTLGKAVPDGKGVPISIVEAGGSSHRNYWPNMSHSSGDFLSPTPPFEVEVILHDGSSVGNKTISSHATSQARNFFGNFSSIAPEANEAWVYEAGLFLNQQLGAPNGGTPQFLNFRVQNHSWVGTLAADKDNPTPTELAQDVQTLRRFDFMINRDNVTAFVGIDNEQTPLPRLLSQSYNALTIGRSDGIHSTGLTNIAAYGPGRSKPDMVAPRDTSSAATSTTSSAATMLHSVVTGTNASKSQVMKSILMAGATKDEFPGWTRSIAQPLDDTFGAGELNVFNSYLMTLGGRYAGSSTAPVTVGSHGWDFQTAVPGSGNELKYRFLIPEGSTAQELSIVLTWNVNVVGSFTGQTLANLNMKLTDSLGAIVDQSLSTVDNVEHIYIGSGQPTSTLGPGLYTLTVSTDTARDFGLAWRMSTLFDVPSADFDEDGDVDGRDFLAWQRGFGKLINATRADGDANGDGAVDHLDLEEFQAQYGTPAMNSTQLLVFAIPEPTGLVMLAIGSAALLLRRR